MSIKLSNMTLVAIITLALVYVTFSSVTWHDAASPPKQTSSTVFTSAKDPARGYTPRPTRRTYIPAGTSKIDLPPLDPEHSTNAPKIHDLGLGMPTCEAQAFWAAPAHFTAELVDFCYTMPTNQCEGSESGSGLVFDKTCAPKLSFWFDYYRHDDRILLIPRVVLTKDDIFVVRPEVCFKAMMAVFLGCTREFGASVVALSYDGGIDVDDGAGNVVNFSYKWYA